MVRKVMQKGSTVPDALFSLGGLRGTCEYVSFIIRPELKEDINHERLGG